MVLWTNPIYRKMYKGSLFKSTTNLKPIAGKIVGHGVKGGGGGGGGERDKQTNTIDKDGTRGGRKKMETDGNERKF